MNRPAPGAKVVAINLVTVEKFEGKNYNTTVEKYPTVDAARKVMREWLGEYLEDGWTRAKRPKPLRSKPMDMTIEDGEGYTITCTIVRTYDPPRRLRDEPDLSE